MSDFAISDPRIFRLTRCEKKELQRMKTPIGVCSIKAQRSMGVLILKYSVAFYEIILT